MALTSSVPSFPHSESLLMKEVAVVKQRKRCHKDEKIEGEEGGRGG